MQALIALIKQNEYDDLLMALVGGLLLFFALAIVVRFSGKKLSKKAAKTTTYWDNVLADTLLATQTWVLAYACLYLALNNLTVRASLEKLLDRGLMIVVLLQIGLWGSRAVKSWLQHRTTKDQEQGVSNSIANLGVIHVLIQIVFWITIFLLMLDNLGFNISTLVTSLGIGGIAIALAVQNILGDLFASLSIALDKPFVVGDFIIVDSHMGTVKHIGLKTIRVQSLSGEELIFSNTDLLKSRIRNYKRMDQRRITFGFGVVYHTTADQIEHINRIVRTAIEVQAEIRFDRVHLKEFGSSSLNFEVVYYVLDPDFNKYMDIQQAINLFMMREFEEANIQFAFPTQTVHIASMPVEMNAIHPTQKNHTVAPAHTQITPI